MDDVPESARQPPPTNRNERRSVEREQASDAVAEIAAALELLCEPGAWHELRTLNGNGRVAASGYFNDRVLMAKAAVRLNQRGDNVYLSLNPVREELSARSVNHVVDRPKHATKDDEILHRRWLIVDLDPKRASGIAATNAEHDTALARAEQIRQWLMVERNWFAPIMMDSGNGSYLLWRINLPNDDAARTLVTAVLQALARRFNDDKVAIDTGMFNAARVARIPFTRNRKGDDTDNRPHRLAKLLYVPSELCPVSREQLQQVASEVAVESSDTQPLTSASPELQAVLAAIAQRGITVNEPTRYNKDGLKYILSACLFNSNHGGTSVAIIEYAKGAKQYSCLHDECRGKRWGDVLRLLQPETSQQNSKAGQHSRIEISQLPDVRRLASEKVEYLVPRLLVKGTITLISGPPGVGKTTLALHLGDAIANGKTILGGVCEKHPVLYVTREMPLGFAADVARRFGIDNGPNANFYWWGPWNEQSPPEPAAAGILEWVSKCESHPVIIIDPLVAFLPDGASENDAVEVRRFFSQLRTLLAAGAAGVVVITHVGKAVSAAQFRGSSDIGAAVDAAYLVTNSGDRELERLHLSLFKPRYLDQLRDLVLLYSEKDGVASFTPDKRPAAVAITVREQLTNLFKTMQGCTTTEFVSAAMAKKITQKKARDYLTDGVKNGKIVIDEGSRHNVKYHRFADGSTLFTPDDGATVQ